MLIRVVVVALTMIYVSTALATEPGWSNSAGVVRITCAADAYTPFGLPFTFWNAPLGEPVYGVASNRPSDVIGEQLTGGTYGTADRVIRQGGSWAYRTTTSALWAGGLETDSGMIPGGAFWIWNRHAFNQEMLLAGEVDSSAFGPIVIAANSYTPLSFRDARLVNRANLNLLTCGFTGGTYATSDRLIEQGGSWCYFRTSNNTWQGLAYVTPGKAYWIWNRHDIAWDYYYGSGAMAPPPGRPSRDEKIIDHDSQPNRPGRSVR